MQFVAVRVQGPLVMTHGASVAGPGAGAGAGAAVGAAVGADVGAGPGPGAGAGDDPPGTRGLGRFEPTVNVRRVA
jgi:hypothetical protein